MEVLFFFFLKKKKNIPVKAVWSMTVSSPKGKELSPLTSQRVATWISQNPLQLLHTWAELHEAAGANERAGTMDLCPAEVAPMSSDSDGFMNVGQTF